MKTLMSKILIKARQEKQISQATVAKALGVSKMTVSSWEVGKTIPRKKVLNGIAKIYGIEESPPHPRDFSHELGGVNIFV